MQRGEGMEEVCSNLNIKNKNKKESKLENHMIRCPNKKITMADVQSFSIYKFGTIKMLHNA